MVRSDCFAHECPGELDLGGRLEEIGYLVGGLLEWAFGENVAWGIGSHGTPQAIVGAWMDSPPHRATMLHDGFRDAGVGFAVASNGAGYFTLDLGLRQR